MKTIGQALIDEIHYPIPVGFVENKLIERGLEWDEEYDSEVFNSNEYKGALADCLYSLITSINYSESDKSIGALTDKQREAILARANKLYGEIGEEQVEDLRPKVYILS